MSYDAVNVYVDLMKSVEEAEGGLVADAQWEGLTMRGTDKVDILLLLRSIVLG